MLRLKTGILNFRVMTVRDIKLWRYSCRKIYTYFGVFSLFRSLSIRKSTYLNVCLISSDNPAAMLVSLGGTPTWRLHTELCKFVQNISKNI